VICVRRLKWSTVPFTSLNARVRRQQLAPRWRQYRRQRSSNTDRRMSAFYPALLGFRSEGGASSWHRAAAELSRDFVSEVTAGRSRLAVSWRLERIARRTTSTTRAPLPVSLGVESHAFLGVIGLTSAAVRCGDASRLRRQLLIDAAPAAAAAASARRLPVSKLRKQMHCRRSTRRRRRRRTTPIKRRDGGGCGDDRRRCYGRLTVSPRTAGRCVWHQTVIAGRRLMVSTNCNRSNIGQLILCRAPFDDVTTIIPLCRAAFCHVTTVAFAVHVQ